MTDLLSTPPVNPPATTPPASTPPVDLPEFLKGAQLDAEIMNEPSIRNIKDLNSLAKSYVHAQKMIGADKIIIPQKGATKEQWNEVFTKLGLPKKEEYKLSKIENSVLGEDFYNKVTDLGHSLGILPSQMQEFVQSLETDAQSKFEANKTKHEQLMNEASTNLKKEWGEAFDARLHNAKTVLEKFGDDETKQFIRESGLGNDPRIVKFLEKIGSSLKEAKMIDGPTTPQGRDDYQTQLNGILNDKNHPYWNQSHIGHAQAKTQVSELFQKLS